MGFLLSTSCSVSAFNRIMISMVCFLSSWLHDTKDKYVKIIKTFFFSHYTQQVLKFTLNKVCSSCFTFSMKDKRHTYVTRRFLTCNVLKDSWFIHEINYLIKVCTFLPSIFMTGVHPPSPHPKFPMWQKTDNGWESTRRVTTPLTLDLLNQWKKKEIQQVTKTIMVK